VRETAFQNSRVKQQEDGRAVRVWGLKLGSPQMPSKVLETLVVLFRYPQMLHR
jgi:hypothetical protein